MSRWPNKYVIGLTGNIATGKSVVRKMLQHSGAYTLDADQLVHQTMMPGAPAYKPVVQTFGTGILGPDKRINRAALGKIVFSNAEALKKLEDITHPIVRQALDVLVKRAKQRVVVIEAIKLLEGDTKDWVDTIWVVNASKKSQYIRLVGQRKMSEEDAKQRILGQNPQEEKVKAANVVIENDGDVEKTWKQVQAQWAEIRRVLTSGPAKPATGAQPAASAAPEPVEEGDIGLEDAKSVEVEGLSVIRGTPNNAQGIADFRNANGTGENVTRMDVMMSFGQKSYLMAQDANQDVVALLGWTVENLVTRMDEFYIKAGFSEHAAIRAIVVAVEDASKDLMSEAAFLFLPTGAKESIVSAFNDNGYSSITLKEIKIPVWREAVEEMLRTGELQVLWKQLRKDRVLQPI